jgi:transposase InsO family protein
MTKDQMIFNHRLSLLSRAKSINNISAACREAGVSRTYYYKWMARFLTYGSQGLYERQRPKPKMPNSTRSDIVEKILNFIKLYPTYGPARIANEIGGMVCPTTVYNILRRRGLSKKIDRLLALEDIPVTVKISPIMARKIYEEKPLLSIKSYHTGYMLSVDTFYVCRLKGIGRIYQFTAIDTYSSFGFAHLYTDKTSKSAVDFLDRTIGIFKDMGITVERALTDNGKEYTTHWEDGDHEFEKYLDFKHIEHRYTKVRHPWTNGFVERFNKTILEEFYQPSLLTKVYGSLSELQYDLDRFLYFYNFQRTHQGYRTRGSKPCDLLYKCGDNFLSSP